MEKRNSENLIDLLIKRPGLGELVVLESQLKGHPASGQSFLAAKPVGSICAYGTRIERTENGIKKVFEQDPWEALKEYQAEKKNWLFGYLGYDLKNYLEDVYSKNMSLVPTPDYYFIEPSFLLRIEGEDGKIILGDDSMLTGAGGDSGYIHGSLTNIRPGIDKQDYIKNISRIKEKIKEGDFYELNYSYALEADFRGDPYWLYSKMREINPVPFGGFIRSNQFAVCCASPERFLKKTGRNIISEPIKGTSQRSDQPDADRHFRELLLNEKNRAENLMIVDLVRHDLSRVTVPGSVRVSKLFDIQTFGTVHQLISTVEGEAVEGVNPVDIIRSCYPMGSMTGAPKIPVMKAIDEFENYRRGIYSGAIGYFTPAGDFDFNVVIRSAIIHDQKLIYPVGGAITSDSDPEEEWEETEIKSRNLIHVFSDQPSFSK